MATVQIKSSNRRKIKSPQSTTNTQRTVDSGVHYGLGREKTEEINAPTRQIVAGNGQRVYQEVYQPEESLASYSGKGTPSLFNSYALFMHPLCNTINDFYDRAGEVGVFRHEIEQKKLTVSQLISDFTPDKTPQTPYYANDFLWAKFYGKMPLNRLITLRRFGFPVYDNLQFAAKTGETNIAPIAQAITYFGDGTGNQLSTLMAITGNIGWKEVKAQIWDTASQSMPSAQTQSQAVGSMLPRFGRLRLGDYARRGMMTTAKAMTYIGTNVNSDLSGASRDAVTAYKASTDFSYIHKTLGPINVITSTQTRDTGIGAPLSLTLKFDYILRSYNNISPKLAMIDLLSNLLALTYYHAKFWGGANRFTPVAQEQFGFIGNMSDFYSGNYAGFVKSLKDGIGRTFSAVAGGFERLFTGLMSGNFSAVLSQLMSGGGQQLKNVMNVNTRASRPNPVIMHSIISGVPVGEYHLVIGNPYNPIFTIGNLILESFTITPGDDLSFDDFPDKWTLTVKLKKARPMDSGDIQSILAYGQGRTYSIPKGVVQKFLNIEQDRVATEYNDGVLSEEKIEQMGTTKTNVAVAGGVVY